MLKKRLVYVSFIILAILATAQITKAMPDPFATLVVWPVDTPEGSEGPMVTTSPAKLIIYNNDAARALDDLWLLLVINEATYANLVSISTNTTLTFLPGGFNEILSTDSPSTKIPEDGAIAPPDWPGVYEDDKYDVGSLRDKLGIASGESMYYAVGDLDSSTGWDDPDGELNKVDPEYFTLTVNVGGSTDNWKVLVLAFGHGHAGDQDHSGILNVHSPYTRSSLVIVPEIPLGTVAILLSWIGVLGVFAVRKRRISR